MKSNKYGYEGLVLIIDAPSSIMIQRFMRAISVEYLKTFDAEEAVKLAEINQPALILMHIYFSGMHNIIAHDLLKSNDKTKHIPIVILEPEGAASIAKKLGAPYIYHPFSLKSSHKYLEKYLKK